MTARPFCPTCCCIWWRLRWLRLHSGRGSVLVLFDIVLRSYRFYIFLIKASIALLLEFPQCSRNRGPLGWSVLHQLFEFICWNVAGLHGSFRGVFVDLELSSCASPAFAELSVTKLLWESIIRHPDNIANPAELVTFLNVFQRRAFSFSKIVRSLQVIPRNFWSEHMW